MTDGRMKKQYLAVVCGKPEQKEARLVDYLLKDGRTNTSSSVREGTKGAKRAELIYRVRKEASEYTLVEIDLLTGRHHQIRVQMAGAGMPVAGDRKYNSGLGEQKRRKRWLWRHSRLGFSHPVTSKNMCFEAEPEGALFDLFSNV